MYTHTDKHIHEISMFLYGLEKKDNVNCNDD